MPRRNSNIRRTLTAESRQAARDRKRSRMDQRAKHVNRAVNKATYRKD